MLLFIWSCFYLILLPIKTTLFFYNALKCKNLKIKIISTLFSTWLYVLKFQRLKKWGKHNSLWQLSRNIQQVSWLSCYHQHGGELGLFPVRTGIGPPYVCSSNLHLFLELEPSWGAGPTFLTITQFIATSWPIDCLYLCLPAACRSLRTPLPPLFH